MALEKAQINSMSKELVSAEKNRKPIEPFTDRFPTITIPDAYAIQLKTIETKLKSGSVLVGMKIGLTSKPMQEMFKVDVPDYGHILDNMLALEGTPISMKRLIQPRMESEICFILNRDLKGPGVTTTDVLAATVGVVPAFEIIDSRNQNWRIKIQDTIADNAGTGMVVLAGKLTPIADIDLRLVGVMVQKNGDLLATGAGAAVWGNPVQSVAWLANTLSTYGISLKAGQFIMSGSLTAAFPIAPGDNFVATFDRLGPVSTKFVD